MTSTTSSIGFIHSEETKKLLSELAKNRKISSETKKKISEQLKGVNNPFFVKQHSIEFKENMSNLHKGENNPMYNKNKSPEFIKMMYKDKTGKNNPNAKSYKVINTLTNESIIYSTFKEAYESINVSKAGAYKAYKNNRTTFGKMKI